MGTQMACSVLVEEQADSASLVSGSGGVTQKSYMSADCVLRLEAALKDMMPDSRCKIKTRLPRCARNRWKDKEKARMFFFFVLIQRSKNQDCTEFAKNRLFRLKSFNPAAAPKRFLRLNNLFSSRKFCECHSNKDSYWCEFSFPRVLIRRQFCDVRERGGVRE